jgi:hypothetical protein
VHGLELKSHVRNLNVFYVGMHGYLQEYTFAILESEARSSRSGARRLGVAEGVHEDLWSFGFGGCVRFGELEEKTGLSRVSYEPPEFVEAVVSRRCRAGLLGARKNLTRLFAVMWRSRRVFLRGVGERVTFVRFFLFEVRAFLAGYCGYVDASLKHLYDAMAAELEVSSEWGSERATRGSEGSEALQRDICCCSC